ncbi:MAG: hypothetical protein IBJ04_11520 [Hydrogenophaga sp.]|uniref:hypothetical protein n=1 Tax=Hydrogenophaga sp. TaxID=1904254 RepID=UPI00257BA50F|nr:hypothetical protein [Hydrogenophaga sp.]MBL0944947.1 hypothetical protein [Hydrogenophaga sp.]
MRLRTACIVGSLGLALAGVQAEQTQSQGNGSRSTTARLDFELRIERMLYLRIGSGGAHAGTPAGTGPAASAAVSSADFTLSPAGLPDNPGGNGPTKAWGGAAPGFVASAAVVVPVEVRSNAGQVSLVAQTAGGLTSPGGGFISLNQLTVSSDNSSLPAPPHLARGTGPSVNVATGGSGTGAAGTLLTYRTAHWTLQFTPPATPPAAGTYSSLIVYTASSP